MTDPRRMLPVLVPRPEERYAPFPLTDVQEAYWLGRSGFFDLGAVGTNIFMEFVMTGDESAVDDLEAATGILLDRHPMLRARMLPDGRQRILAQVPPFRIERRSLRGRSSASQASELDDLRRRLRLENAALDRWPLFEVVTCLEDDQRVRLLMRVDALIMDGKSRQAFVRELFQIADDRKLRLPPIECTYRDYALAWAELQDGESGRAAREYWTAKVAGLAPGPKLPLKREVEPGTFAPLETLSLKLLAADAWAGLKRRGVQAGVTPSAIAVAAFAEVLRGVGDPSRFTLSLIGSWRPPIHPQIDEVLGNFNTISLLAIDEKPASFRDGVIQLQRQIMADLNQAGYSGLRALRQLNRRHRTGSATAVPVLFNSLLYHIAPGSKRAPARAASARRRRCVTASMCIPQAVLIPTVAERGDGTLECVWQSTTSLFAPGYMEGLATAYRQGLERLAADEAAWDGAARASVQVPSVSPRATPVIQDGPGLPDVSGTVPSGDLVTRLRDLWADTLGGPPAPGCDFHDQGGDSLRAVQLLLRVEQSFARRLPSDMLRRPLTIASLAAALQRASPAIDEPAACEGEQAAAS
jgi:pyochelin synthetase